MSNNHPPKLFIQMDPATLPGTLSAYDLDGNKSLGLLCWALNELQFPLILCYFILCLCFKCGNQTVFLSQPEEVARDHAKTT